MAELYWITVLGNIRDAILLVCGILAFILFVLCIALCTEALTIDTAKRWIYRCGGSFIFLLFLQCFVPSTTRLYAIYGIGTVIDYVQNSEEVQNVPDNVFKAINAYLENIIDDNQGKSDK